MIASNTDEESDGIITCLYRNITATVNEIVERSAKIHIAIPVVVATELHLTSVEISGYLPATFLLIISKVGVGIPVAIGCSDNADIFNLLQRITQVRCIEINTIETCTWIRTVRTTRRCQCTTHGSTVYILEVVVPVISIGLELELTIEVVESLILAIAIASEELMTCGPSALVTNLLEELTEVEC